MVPSVAPEGIRAPDASEAGDGAGGALASARLPAGGDGDRVASGAAPGGEAGRTADTAGAGATVSAGRRAGAGARVDTGGEPAPVIRSSIGTSFLR